jgi:adenylate kinase family enzyme
VRRVSVVGNSGSGKTTLARELAAILGAPCLELDSVFHQPGWMPLPAEDFRARVAKMAAGDGWVIDGNYGTVQSLVWARADTVVWLDLPRYVVMRQILWRTVRRVVCRKELWNGNRERWANLFTWDPQESVISWSWHKHAAYRVKYAAAVSDPANADLRFIRLQSRRDVRSFIVGARAAAGSSSSANPVT